MFFDPLCLLCCALCCRYYGLVPYSVFMVFLAVIHQILWKTELNARVLPPAHTRARHAAGHYIKGFLVPASVLFLIGFRRYSDSELIQSALVVAFGALIFLVRNLISYLHHSMNAPYAIISSALWVPASSALFSYVVRVQFCMCVFSLLFRYYIFVLEMH
jgi:hypothetical protein